MAARALKGTVVEVAVSWLTPWPENPRWIRDERLAELERALVEDPEMLWARPLLVLPDGTVIAGNQRLLAAGRLGLESLPVLIVDLDPVRARLWALRDNSQYGEWDEPSLSELLAGLEAEGVELALTGFSSSELDRLLDGFRAEPDPDEAPPLPTGEPESKPGEVYELGPHRVLCGDSRDPDALAALLAGEQAGLLVTDPPYGVAYVGKTERALTFANDDADGLAGLLREAFSVADRVLVPSAPFYVFSPAGPLGTEFRLALQETGWRLQQTLVWEKQKIVLGRTDYHYQHEDILYGWTSGPGRPGRGRHDGTRWCGDDKQPSVFRADRPARSELHPTQKPVELLATMLRNSSRRGEIVLDPFAGSGSTLVAADRLGRRCFAVELDPAYVDVIRGRYEEYCNGRV